MATPAANHLRVHPSIEITLVNPRPTFIERIRLHQLVAGTGTATADYGTLLGEDIRLVVDTAARIDTKACRVVSNSGTALDYDYLRRDGEMGERMARRIIVVGAGIAGLATAVGLQQRGHDVTIIEERSDTSSGAGISIWPNALAALDYIGLGDTVRAAGARVTAGALRSHDGAWLRRPSTDRFVGALGEPLVVIQRAVLRDILTGGLTAGTVEYGRAARGLVLTTNGIRLQLSDSTVRAADAVIGADGTHSIVARHLNGPLNQRYAGYTAWRGIAKYAMDPEFAGVTLGPGVETGHVPMGADLTYWFTTERLPEGHCVPEGELEHVRAKLGHWAEPIPSILAATAPTDLFRDDLYDRTPIRRWACGPIVLVGDAAHPMRPHLGQGGCQGLEDAAILAAIVDQTPALSTAFDRFATLRRQRIKSIVRESALIGKAANGT